MPRRRGVRCAVRYLRVDNNVAWRNKEVLCMQGFDLVRVFYRVFLVGGTFPWMAVVCVLQGDSKFQIDHWF